MKCGEKKKKKKLQRIAIIKVGSSGALLALIIYTFTLGWFTNSKHDETDGLSGSAIDRGYRIITGSFDDYHSGVYDSMYVDASGNKLTTLEKSDVNSDEGKSNYVTFFDENSNELSGYVSDGEVISWQMTEQGNVENDTESSIAPGTQGYIDFYIQPTKIGTISVDITLDLVAFSRVNDDADSDENTETTEIITDETEVASEASEKIVEEENDMLKTYHRLNDDAACQLIKGHILLFTEDEDGNLQWRTCDTNSSSSFTVTLDVKESDAVETDGSYKAVRERIYWVWPQTWGQLTLGSSDLAQQDSGNSPISEVLQDVIKNANDANNAVEISQDITLSRLKVLFSENATEPYELFFTETDMDSVKKSMSDALDGKAAVYSTMKKAWNNADQQIGKKVAYITLELTARPSTDSKEQSGDIIENEKEDETDSDE